MSANPRTAKAGVVGFFKSLFGKPGGGPAGGPVATTTNGNAPSAAVRSLGAAPSPEAASVHGGKGLELPLSSIVSGLPAELQARIRPVGENPQLSIPLDRILSQLSRGVVKISFGELRRCGPQFFTGAADRDALPVVLPLAEILTRLNPAFITRRRPQKRVQVPAEIGSPFDGRGRGLSVSVPPAKPEAAPGPRPEEVPPPPSVSSISSLRGNIAAVPAVEPPGAPIPFSMPPPSRLAASAQVVPMQVLPVQAVPTPAPVPSLPGPRVRPPISEAPALVVAVSALAQNWPEAIRHELFQFNLLEAKISLPAESIEPALQRGRITFPWKTLRGWMKPAPLPVPSPHDNASLELPLNLIAPLFLATRAEAGRRQRITIDETIPNLFFGRQPAESVPPGSPPHGAAIVASKPTDTNFYPAEGNHPVRNTEAHSAVPATSGTSFVARYATPNELVSRAASLDGVAGALIALPDGLMVASQLSSELNGDTLAAFLPQIMAKVSQCTKELRMGELNNLNFTVGQVAWKIFRVNSIFFAAFGRPAEPLPTAQLAALAAELDRKPK